MSFKEWGKRPTSSSGSGDEVGERPIFGLPHGICPRFSKCIFPFLKLRYFYLGAQNENKSSRGIIRLSKEDMELFKATKSRFTLRFFRFARDRDLESVKFALKCEPNHGLQIDFTRPEQTLQYGECCF